MTQAHMVEGEWYRLEPPANIQGKSFHVVVCDYQVPDSPNEYCVSGTPEGSEEKEAFVLVFKPNGRVRATVTSPPET